MQNSRHQAVEARIDFYGAPAQNTSSTFSLVPSTAARFAHRARLFFVLPAFETIGVTLDARIKL